MIYSADSFVCHYFKLYICIKN